MKRPVVFALDGDPAALRVVDEELRKRYRTDYDVVALTAPEGALRQLGVVEAEPAGRFTYYRLRPEALEAVSAHYAALAERARAAAAVKRPCD